MRPTIFVALGADDFISDARVNHPNDKPKWGGEWVVYVPAGKSERLEAEVERLKALLNQSCCHSHGEVAAPVGVCEWCDAAREVFKQEVES